MQTEPGGFGQGVHKRGRVLDLIRGGWPCSGEGCVEGGVESIECGGSSGGGQGNGTEAGGLWAQGSFYFCFLSESDCHVFWADRDDPVEKDRVLARWEGTVAGAQSLGR